MTCVEWSPEKRLRTWDAAIAQLFADEAKYLHHQLDIRRLTVVLVPAPQPQHSGHMIRVVVEQNPPWYREMWQEYGRVRRYLSMPSLERLATLTDGAYDRRNCKYWYDMIYRRLIFERLTEGCEDMMDYLHPSKDVRKYFGLGLHPLHLGEGLECQLNDEEIPF